MSSSSKSSSDPKSSGTRIETTIEIPSPDDIASASATEGPDPFGESYREHITEPTRLLGSLAPKNVALLVIDMQYLDAARGHGVFAPDAPMHISKHDQAYYFNQIERVVVPNIARLQKSFRSHNLEVIHTRIQSLTLDGRDRSIGHQRLGIHAAPGSKDAEFLPEIAPLPNEIVINKTASGVFNATNIEDAVVFNI